MLSPLPVTLRSLWLKAADGSTTLRWLPLALPRVGRLQVGEAGRRKRTPRPTHQPSPRARIRHHPVCRATLTRERLLLAKLSLWPTRGVRPPNRAAALVTTTNSHAPYPLDMQPS